MGQKQFVLPVLLIAIVTLLGFWILGNQNNSKWQDKVSLAGQTFYVKIANDDDQRVKGLSDTESLDTYEGMLFVFEQPGAYCFWMKDMNYPLDIIWINENKQIITRYQNLPPDSYPQSFCPSGKAKYVLEVPAGTIERLKLNLGDQVGF